MSEEVRTEYYRILEDGQTVCFYFNVKAAASDGMGVKHDAGAEIKLSEWEAGIPTEEALEELQNTYLKMSKAGTLEIGNCKAEIMTTAMYEAMYGFLDDGSFELASERFNGFDPEPGPISTTKRDTNKVE